MFDADGKQPVKVAATSMIVKRGESLFTLDPEEVDDLGQTSRYCLDDQNLMVAMNLGVVIEMTIGETTYQSDVPPHSHAHTH